MTEVPLLTPDKRYIVVRGRLWRAMNPGLSKHRRKLLTKQLMDARRAVAAAQKTKDPRRLALARKSVQAAKVGLGERGPAWWTDGSRDYNRFLVKNTPYKDWFARYGKDVKLISSGTAAARGLTTGSSRRPWRRHRGRPAYRASRRQAAAEPGR